MAEKNQAEAIKAYKQTLKEVRELIKDKPGMTITRFYDIAARKLIKAINKRNEETAKLSPESESNSKTT